MLEAAKEMKEFITTHKGNYRWLKANEVFGDLAVAAGNFKASEAYYDQLRKSPFPDYKMRAGVRIGRALMAQGGAENLAAAGKAFDEALAIPADTDAAKTQRLDATLGKARLLALAGKFDDAIKTVEPIIATASREQAETLAHAYNTLGVAYRAAKKPKDSLMAFLHVDLLYPSVPDAHAEALYNLTIAVVGNGQRPAGRRGEEGPDPEIRQQPLGEEIGGFVGRPAKRVAGGIGLHPQEGSKWRGGSATATRTKDAAFAERKATERLSGIRRPALYDHPGFQVH